MIYQLNVRGLGENFKRFYEGGLNNLLERAPSDACACSSIVRSGRGYLGVLDIFSSEGHFKAKSFGKNPHNLIQSLFIQMQHQFKKWHHERGLFVA